MAIKDNAQRRAMEETYRDVEDIICRITMMYLQQRGGDFEELKAEANLIFMKVFRTYDKSVGISFENWVKYKIFRELISNGRKVASRSKRLNHAQGVGGSEQLGETASDPLQELPQPEAPRFSLSGLLRILSDDAKHVVRITLDMPRDVIHAARARSAAGTENPKSIRAALHEFLKDSGWEPSRVRDSFEEIQEALKLA